MKNILCINLTFMNHEIDVLPISNTFFASEAKGCSTSTL